jgi:hypothetical protein
VGRTLAIIAVAAAVVGVPTAAAGIGFGKPVYVSSGPAFQAGEPSIRVDASDPKQRIWIAAPSGIGVDSRSLPEDADTGGDIFWYSDDDGKSWTHAPGTAGVGGPTIVGGGDSDVATGPGGEVYGTGLTLANVTLAASCDNGDTFTTNPFSAPGGGDDRQWIDTYEDRAKPVGAPDLVLDYGNIGAARILVHQVFSPACAPPIGNVPLDVTLANTCPVPVLADPTCYQWPGNVAVDERTGDVYATYNTQGDPDHDDIVVSRIAGGASRPATQLDVSTHVAAHDRQDTFDSFTVVAVDRGRNVYVVWSERHHAAKETATMLAVSTDRGQTWSKPRQVNKSPKTTTFPWIVAGEAGKIDIVYYGTSSTGPSPETVPQSSTWKVYMAQSTNALSSKPTFTEAVASPPIQRGSICTSGTGCAAGTRDLLDFFQVDVDRAGFANIAYTDNLNTPPAGSDPHQEWITFVQQKDGTRLFGGTP